MKKVSDFHVVHAQREPVARMRLVRADTGASIELDAASLLAQYETGSGDILMIADEDCPL